MTSPAPTEPEAAAANEMAEPITLRTLSPSRASDFKQCPQLYKFRSIDKLPEPTTVHQARGTTAHLALEWFYDLPATERVPEVLYDLFRKAWTELRGTEEYAHLFESAEEERAWGLGSMELLANYFGIEDPTKVVPMARELDLLEDLDGMVIRGILDRIDERPDGELVILDYKTGKAPPERYSASAFFAMKIYALLIRQRLGRTPVELRLIYLNGPTQYSMPVDDAVLDGVHKQVQAIWNSIVRAIETETWQPSTSRLCDWCSFQDICPAFAD